MKFSPFFVIIIALSSVLLIYQLPKSIVDNKDKSVENKKQASQETAKDSHNQMTNWTEKVQKEKGARETTRYGERNRPC